MIAGIVRFFSSDLTVPDAQRPLIRWWTPWFLRVRPASGLGMPWVFSQLSIF